MLTRLQAPIANLANTNRRLLRTLPLKDIPREPGCRACGRRLDLTRASAAGDGGLEAAAVGEPGDEGPHGGKGAADDCRHDLDVGPVAGGDVGVC